MPAAIEIDDKIEEFKDLGVCAVDLYRISFSSMEKISKSPKEFFSDATLPRGKVLRNGLGEIDPNLKYDPWTLGKPWKVPLAGPRESKLLSITECIRKDRIVFDIWKNEDMYFTFSKYGVDKSGDDFIAILPERSLILVSPH